MGCEWPVTHLFYLLGIVTGCVETEFFLADENQGFEQASIWLTFYYPVSPGN